MDKSDLTRILEDTPKGTKLYSPLFGEVEFSEVRVRNKQYYIIVKLQSSISENREAVFSSSGRYFPEFENSERMLFPSKENRDWDNFHPYKQGVPYMVSDNKVSWSLRYYAGNGKFYLNNEQGSDYILTVWKYVVPFEDFNPENY